MRILFLGFEQSFFSQTHFDQIVLDQVTSETKTPDLLIKVFLSLTLAGLLSTLIAWIYRRTHRGVSYSQSFTQTLIVLGMVVAAVMSVVGSNLARAFALLGALSIVRFRNAVKETRDVGFVFWVMAIGMAAGTQLYGIASISTLLIGLAILWMSAQDAFRKASIDRVLKIRFPGHETDAEKQLEPILKKLCEESLLLSVESVSGGVQIEFIYHIVLNPKNSVEKLLSEIRQVNQNYKVALHVGQHEVDL